jgi:hypothetical protein
MKITRLLLAASIGSLLSGCDLFDYHAYDGRLTGETGINAKNKALIDSLCAQKTTVRFVFTGDTQRKYDDTEDFVKSINKRADIDFVLHGGDVTDFGLTKEFLWMRDILNGLKVPYVVLLGNHDCLADGESVFKKVFGEPNFSFMAGNTKFVCLNTNALEFDYSRPVPDFEFLENEMNDSSANYERTIVAMHVRPYSEQFNNNVAKVFEHYIKQYKDLQFCLNAHDHGLSIVDLFGDGVMYFGVPAVYRRKYIVFTLKPDNKYEYEIVDF